MYLLNRNIMKHLFAWLLIGASITGLQAQDLGGCTSYFADNYDPIATYNDSTCVYDLQQLLVEGTSIGDLLFSGVLESELIGLFAAGGIIVHIDAENGRSLIGSAHSTDLHYYSSSACESNEILTGSLLAEELTAYQFGSQLYEGELNWDILKESYAAERGRWTNNSSSGYGLPYADVAMSRTFSNMGFNDWFVPNSSELSAYWDVVLNEDVYQSEIQWPLDPNGNASYTLMAPFSGWSASNNRCVTSEIINAGVPSDFVNNQLVYPQALIRGFSNNDTYYSINGNAENPISGGGCIYVQPMRIEVFNAVGTSVSCNSWEYAGVLNQPIDAGVTCTYPLFQCDSVTSDVWDELVIGIYPANNSVVEYGRSDTRDILLNIPSTHEIDGNIYDVIGFEVNSVSNVPTGLTINIAESDVVNGSDVHCIEFAEHALEEGIFDLDIAGTLYMDILGSTLTADITLEHLIAVTANVSGVEGCIYPTADNYNALATDDDGTCLFGGICPGDFNNDGIIGIMDILHLLGIYDTTCE